MEAGLRSIIENAEEINRILTDHASDLLFAPTEIAIKDFPGNSRKKIVRTGDVMLDAALTLEKWHKNGQRSLKI